MNKKYVVVVLLLLLVNSVWAIGLSPPKHVIDFKPDLEDTITFRVHNTNDNVVYFRVLLEGDSPNYITLEDELIAMKPRSFEKMKMYIKLPKTLPPGDNALPFKVVEESQGEGTFSVSTAIRSFVVVDVPYPGEYLKATISASNVRSGEPVPIIVTIENDGTENVAVSKGVVSVTGVDLLDLIPISFENIPAQQSVTQTVMWDNLDAVVGEYEAKIVADFEGGSTSAVTNFKIGDILVNIFDIVAESTYQGWRASVDIEVDSMWNEPIENVYAEVNIYDQYAKSQSETVQPWSKQKLTAYIDTTNLAVGDHKGKAIVYYVNETVSKDFVLTVEKPINMYMVVGLVVVACFIVFGIILFVIKYKQPKQVNQSRGRYNQNQYNQYYK